MRYRGCEGALEGYTYTVCQVGSLMGDCDRKKRNRIRASRAFVRPSKVTAAGNPTFAGSPLCLIVIRTFSRMVAHLKTSFVLRLRLKTINPSRFRQRRVFCGREMVPNEISDGQCIPVACQV